ncbi:hypothetical protein D3C78_1985110 [compost metagenome]
MEWKAILTGRFSKLKEKVPFMGVLPAVTARPAMTLTRLMIDWPSLAGMPGSRSMWPSTR